MVRRLQEGCCRCTCSCSQNGVEVQHVHGALQEGWPPLQHGGEPRLRRLPCQQRMQGAVDARRGLYACKGIG